MCHTAFIRQTISIPTTTRAPTKKDNRAPQCNHRHIHTDLTYHWSALHIIRCRTLTHRGSVIFVSQFIQQSKTSRPEWSATTVGLEGWRPLPSAWRDMLISGGDTSLIITCPLLITQDSHDMQFCCCPVILLDILTILCSFFLLFTDN